MKTMREKDEIRKGPWKAEEDKVLINHVNRCGPRDWSSIRSKGLLLRTGKSCRLRWVNKLRPNLKNGCKFSIEEERVVIERQAQFGNKWAKIATYLQGRTDNDVKNFWSSRQKRLARILQSAKSSTSSQKPYREASVSHHNPPTFEAPAFHLAIDEESSSKPLSCSSSTSHIDNLETIKTAQLPDLIYPNNNCHHNYITADNYNPCTHTELQPKLTFSQIPQPPPAELLFMSENQQLVIQLDEPNFMDVFEHEDGPQFPVGFTCFDIGETCHNGASESIGDPIGPDSFFDDFPTDMFDHMEPLPSPSEWPIVEQKLDLGKFD